MKRVEELLPKKGTKIVVAMSGGVDSSVAAGWLKEQGYEVIGISLQLHDLSEDVENKFGTCCSLSDIQDARRVAETIGIPFYVTNMEVKFDKEVIDNFVDEYLNGRTPNPCVKCNQKVKFSQLMEWALDLGAEYLATGHYANVRFNPSTDLFELCKGADPQKDQSYFLFPIQQKDLARTLFPVGNLHKDQVRELARKLNLSIADKPDSQEICFVQSRSYKEFIETRVPASLLQHKGYFIDSSGNILGEHTGIHQFTIGQRKGLGALEKHEAWYVTAIDPKNNTVTVGPDSDLFKKHCVVSDLHWINPPALQKNPKYQAKIRYRSVESPTRLKPLLDNRVEVEFEIPQRAITPGQAMVFYDEDRVIGGGWIEEVLG